MTCLLDELVCWCYVSEWWCSWGDWHYEDGDVVVMYNENGVSEWIYDSAGCKFLVVYIIPSSVEKDGIQVILVFFCLFMIMLRRPVLISVFMWVSLGRMMKFMGREPFGNLLALLSPASPTESFETDICWRINCHCLDVGMMVFK